MIQDRALFSETKYNWTTAKSTSTWYFLDTKTGNTTKAPFGSAVSEVVWVGDSDDSILYLNSSNAQIPGGVTLYTADLSASTFAPYVIYTIIMRYITTNIESFRKLVASLGAPFSGLKAAKTESGDINFVVNTLAYGNNGSAYNPELASKAKSLGQLYSSNFVRHWNYYIAQERYSVFAGSLSGGNGSYSFKGEMKNLLSGMNYTVTRPESPVQGSSSDPGDYDLSPDGSMVAFRSKAPELAKANYTASYIYVVPHDGSEVAVPINGPGTSAPETAQGASGYPAWSHDSKKVAYGQQDGIFYESDRYKLYVAEIDGLNSTVRTVAEDWDSSPSGLAWSPDDADLWVISELYASTRLWLVPQDAAADFKPTNFTGPDTYLSDFGVLPDGSAFVSAASSWSSRIFYSQYPGQDKKVLFTANEVDPELKGLGPKDVSNFWVKNDDGDDIQTFVFYPTDFDPSKKYPLAFVVHGGPQSSQGDNWSVRWNLRLWAEQGFIVTTTQFTGTASYGQDFTDKVDTLTLFPPSNMLTPHPDPKQLGRHPLHRPRQSLRTSPRQRPVRRHHPRHCRRRLLRLLHDELDPRPRSGQRIQSPRLPRRQNDQRGLLRHGRNLVHPARQQRHHLERPRQLREMGPLVPCQKLQHPRVRRRKRPRLPRGHFGAPPDVQCSPDAGRAEPLLAFPE
jgi:dipeptidyl aminopeptidase/acylaminoacyl peptidase